MPLIRMRPVSLGLRGVLISNDWCSVKLLSRNLLPKNKSAIFRHLAYATILGAHDINAMLQPRHVSAIQIVDTHHFAIFIRDLPKLVTLSGKVTSNNANFGIRVEVKRGRESPF